MAPVLSYTRPHSLDDALAALARPSAVPIGGGTKLHGGAPGAPVDVVDLQALGLDHIGPPVGATLHIGAAATLQAVVDNPDVPDVVREAARREQPSTLRNQATVGGCIATGDAESELLAALLAYGAVVGLVGGGGASEAPLEEVLAALPLAHGTVITSVRIGTGGTAAAARAARTPADKPIVAAIAHANGAVRIAVAGVASRPVVIGPATVLDPPGDFRGSGEYRAALASVLMARVAEAVR